MIEEFHATLDTLEPALRDQLLSELDDLEAPSRRKVEAASVALAEARRAVKVAEAAAMGDAHHKNKLNATHGAWDPTR